MEIYYRYSVSVFRVLPFGLKDCSALSDPPASQELLVMCRRGAL